MGSARNVIILANIVQAPHSALNAPKVNTLKGFQLMAYVIVTKKVDGFLRCGRPTSAFVPENGSYRLTAVLTVEHISPDA